MSATAHAWVQLQQAIHLRIAELAEVFKKGITAKAAVAVPASGSEPLELSRSLILDQEEAAKNWLAAMGAAGIVQLLAEAHSVWEHPKLWRFLYAISKEEIAPRLKELLYAAFGITQKEIGLIKRWNDAIGGGAGFDPERSTDGISSAYKIARAKKHAVKEILDQLVGVSRKLAFGVPSKPKFGVTAPQINTTTSADASEQKAAVQVPTPIESGRTDDDETPRRNAIAPKIVKKPKGTSTIKEAAILFDVSVKTIRAWATGKVKSRRLRYGPKRGTITNESILKLLKRRR